MKKVLLLGASGSIGTQTLDIIRQYPNEFELVGFSVGKNKEKAEEILEEFKSVKYVYISKKEHAKSLKEFHKEISIFCGKCGLRKLIKKSDFDMCVDALVGFVGLEPAIHVLKKNKILCLANKEALVAGGTIINQLLSEGKGKLYPIDSEHVALAKCLSKCDIKDVKSLIITASGGALRNVEISQLAKQTPEDALRHPTWKMGAKITIDCATMMNKGFEIIEAYYLYHFPLNKIRVQMHDESLIHSAVELNDGTFIVDYGKPDMHEPIKWAMFEGKSEFKVYTVKSLEEFKDCHFHEYDYKRYPCTEIAKQALLEGASKMIALNAANETAVYRFLNHEIGYLDISKFVGKKVEEQKLIRYPSLCQIKRIDRKARKVN